MEGIDKNPRPPLALADASAGCIAAILLFFVQKLPEGSDSKHLYMYLCPVLAIILNNIFSITVKYCSYHYRRRLLKSRFNDLNNQRAEYMKVDNTDADVMNEYNMEIKKTQLAIIGTTLLDLKDEAAATKPKRKGPPNNNPKIP
jgi:hypothetical protein